MGIDDVIKHEYGEIEFCGSIRGGDDSSHHIFRITFQDGGEYYGEFHKKYCANESDYNMNIISFGYKRKLSTGAPHPEARTPFNADEVSKIIEMIRFLFTSKEAEYARNGISQFVLGKYLGEVHFLPDWIRMK